ncbi:MAG: flagellar export chaperone FliS [Nitrospirae bacterium]|nr:MAG: flagellar export chaperone FliS [Nitrospirota bacterium]
MKLQLQRYQTQQVQYDVQQASPVRLIVLLYQKAIFLLKQSLGYLERQDYKAKGEALLHVVDIVSELQSSLNMEEGGMLAQNLDDLYSFLLRTLTMANLSNDADSIRHAIKILEELCRGWSELEQQTASVQNKAQ